MTPNEMIRLAARIEDKRKELRQLEAQFAANMATNATHKRPTLPERVAGVVNAEPGRIWDADEVAAVLGISTNSATSALYGAVNEGKIRKAARCRFVGGPIELPDPQSLLPMERLCSWPDAAPVVDGDCGGLAE